MLASRASPLSFRAFASILVRSRIANRSADEVNLRMLSMPRCVALGHFAAGTLLLLAAVWFAISAFGTLPYMSTGTPYANLSIALLLVATNSLPAAALGVWIVVLGSRLWSGHGRLRRPLLWTHGVLLVLGSLAVAVGTYVVGAAERSSVLGGGLLSPAAFIPLLFGLPVMLLALSSILVALKEFPREQRLSEDYRDSRRDCPPDRDG